MPQSDPAATPPVEFVTLLTEHQPDLWAFLVSLMPGHPDVADVLQKTNIVLWNKRDRFEIGTNFVAWAFQVARYEMLDHLRKRKRDGWVAMDDALADSIAAEFDAVAGQGHARLEALEACLMELRPKDRELLDHRYRKGTNLDDFAKTSGRSVSSLSVTLFRLRAALRRCVAGRLALNPRSA